MAGSLMLAIVGIMDFGYKNGKIAGIGNLPVQQPQGHRRERLDHLSLDL
jgi:hypothetical protein